MKHGAFSAKYSGRKRIRKIIKIKPFCMDLISNWQLIVAKIKHHLAKISPDWISYSVLSEYHQKVRAWNPFRWVRPIPKSGMDRKNPCAEAVHSNCYDFHTFWKFVTEQQLMYCEITENYSHLNIFAKFNIFTFGRKMKRISGFLAFALLVLAGSCHVRARRGFF